MIIDNRPKEQAPAQTDSKQATATPAASVNGVVAIPLKEYTAIVAELSTAREQLKILRRMVLESNYLSNPTFRIVLGLDPEKN